MFSLSCTRLLEVIVAGWFVVSFLSFLSFLSLFVFLSVPQKINGVLFGCTDETTQLMLHHYQLSSERTRWLHEITIQPVDSWKTVGLESDELRVYLRGFSDFGGSSEMTIVLGTDRDSFRSDDPFIYKINKEETTGRLQVVFEKYHAKGLPEDYVNMLANELANTISAHSHDRYIAKDRDAVLGNRCEDLSLFRSRP